MNKKEFLNLDQLDDKQERLASELMPTKFGMVGKLWVGILLVFIALGLVAYYQQMSRGLIVTDMRDFSSWGIYISNFVFFVAISLVGSLVAAILKLVDVPWRTPLTRIAEVIAVSAIAFAGLIIIVDMGRPDRFWHIFAYGRIQSPIIWDVIVITTYLTISVLLLFLPLLPDLALMSKRSARFSKMQLKIYGLLSMGWKGTKEQYAILNRSTKILAVLIIPLALSIHTVTSWLFATTFRVGWDSTNFGPYFVSGAFMVGCAGVIAAMYVLRERYHLHEHIKDMHFDNMGKFLVLLSLIYLYFNVNEYLVTGYKMKNVEGEHLMELFAGSFAPMFWLVQIFGMILPIGVLLFRKGRKPLPLFVTAMFVIVGAWFKRYLIVTPTLLHPFIPMQNLPEQWMHYTPTWQEWSITAGSLAGSLMVITLLIRYFPILPIWEMIEEQHVAPVSSLSEEAV